ncbi:beta-lactamase/transpeptidase-like protein [Auricularia subglabra TFB-10046 SS5]|nr:beta-lactamase/transpeptidase-like protein [Auricularia subglabra TFB-10046 SS5]
MSSLSSRVLEILRTAVSEQNGPVGLVYAAINKHGEIIVEEAAGHRALGSEELMTTDSIFAYFSVTKVITAIASWSRENLPSTNRSKLTCCRPEIAQAQVIQEDLTLLPATTKITLRMLLTHTAGFAYTWQNERKWKYRQLHPFPDETEATMEALLEPLLSFEPGTGWQYGPSIDWAGEVVSRVSGQTLGNYFHDHIFAPLGLEAQDIAIVVSPTVRERVVGIQQRLPDGTMTPRASLKHDRMSDATKFHSGGGGIFGTARTFLSVIVVLLRGGVGANSVRILREETVKEMLADHVACKLPGALEKPMFTAKPEIAYPFPKPQGKPPRLGHGLSFQIQLDGVPATGRSEGSINWGGLANLYWQADPKNGVASVLMCQHTPFADPQVLKPLVAVEKTLCGCL